MILLTVFFYNIIFNKRKKMLNSIKLATRRIIDRNLEQCNISSGGQPVISYGNPNTSEYATLGINPGTGTFNSNEHYFINDIWKDGDEIDDDHVQEMLDRGYEYFDKNFDKIGIKGWFRMFDLLLKGVFDTSYKEKKACHLDLVPFATNLVWSKLPKSHQYRLMRASEDIFALILQNSSITTLLCNGAFVRQMLEGFAEVDFEETLNKNLYLGQKRGYLYSGSINQIGNTHLNREIKVFGWNYNLQSTPGISKDYLNRLIQEIRKMR